MMVLVTGGASCGKSQLAEALCLALGGTRIYAATMQPFGEEGVRRVARHRALRAGKGFETVECPQGLRAVLDCESLGNAVVLLEDLGNLAANALFSQKLDGGSASDPALPVRASAACKELETELDELAGACRHVVVVGNEVGCDGVSYGSETRNYQELLGELSCWCAQQSTLVVECVAGVPVAVKRDVCSADGADIMRAWNSVRREAAQ